MDAANRLFYGEGIRAVSVDAIAEKAGITKKTLYYHFKSKDDLVAEYLVSRDQPNLTAFATWFEEAEGDVADKTAAIFLRLSENARHPKWKGCGFIRTAAELANMPGHPAVVVGAKHKKKFEAWLGDCYQQAGLMEPEMLARRVVLLMEGAFSTMLIHRDPSYAEDAAEAARCVVRLQM
ncbi:transcriptional regulator, TetR family [Pseudovibrio denitrificans]|uniref:Transcriptional regulator, TetR family n=1 Tax=Pseudovibrio denitrificans TaxID=258256 RepID=A0A1I6X9F8_9HYPH|nr:transcriptional regulator, TetR family [Pseudovibrio denitrificans]